MDRRPAALLVYEATGQWHRGLEEHLAGRQPLARVNPLRARRLAQAMGEEAKTDSADARTLAALRDLDALVAARDAPVKDRTARAEFWSLYTGPLTVAAVSPAPTRYEFFFNCERPHASLDYQTPNGYLVSLEAA